jgi:uncharacterized protein (TIGR02246 family)
MIVEPSVVVGVQATIAAYAQALDAGRTEDVVELFCPDGVSEIEGSGTFQGREAIRAAYSGFQPSKPQRHLVANTVVTSWDGDDATAVSDLVLLRRGSAGWVVALAGRYEDTLHRHESRWLFRRRVTTLLP